MHAFVRNGREMTSKGRGRARGWVVAACAATLACGSTAGSSAGFPGDDGTGSTPATSGSGDDGGGVQAAPTFASGDDGGSGVLFTGDASGPATGGSNCQPGTYTGAFKTHVTNDAGGILGLFAALFSLDWDGTISVALQGTATTQQNGEFAYTTLTIAPGATMSGADQYGGHFSATLSGQLDCTTGRFTGSISNGSYVYQGDAGSIAMSGDFSATYDGSTNPPSLRDGQLSVGSPQLATTGASGTWQATKQ
jgi:hypothetical protein